MNKSIKITIAILFLSFSLAGIAFAQETTSTNTANQTASESVNQDENIQAKNLGISEPTVLPNNPLYFFKNLGRSIQSILTLDSVKKAELKEKFANEKLIEAKKLIETGANKKTIEKVINNYQQEMTQVQNAVEKIKGTAETNPEAGKFLDKFIQQKNLQQQILQKLETQVPTSTLEKIKEAREQHLENFAQVMTKLENKEKIQERLEKNLEEVKGSNFNDFKNLEVLKGLETKVSTSVKEAIQKVQETSLNRLQEKLGTMSPEEQEKFKEYLDKIGGDKEKQMEILQNLKTTVNSATATTKILKLREKLEQTETKIIQKIESKLEKANCPSWVPPAEGFCKEGKTYIPKDPNTGCPLPPKCIMPAETNIRQITPGTGACITLWDPVCGKNGKTYSNTCYAKNAGVTIDHSGPCKESTESVAECNLLWWYDNEHKYCQQKKFCGAFMYLGLQTFKAQEECQSVLKNALLQKSITPQNAEPVNAAPTQ